MRDAEYDYGLEPGERFEPDDELDEPFDLSGPHVMTALGPVDPGALGFTLPGEHVISRPPGADAELQLDDVANAAAELEGYALTGGRALVDLTTPDRGRNVEDLLWIAQRVPVHIVAATGYHRPESAASEIERAGVGGFAERMTRELTGAIDGTAVKPGIIVMAAADGEVTKSEALGLSAAARAHVVTGAPISIASERCADALERIAMLEHEGVDPACVIAGSVIGPWDEGDARRVLRSGAFVRVQGWGRSSDGELAALIRQLVDAGYGERVLISGGFARRSQWLAYGGGPGFVHFIDQVPLTLMDAGLDAPAVRQIFVDNPARSLTIHRNVAAT